MSKKLFLDLIWEDFKQSPISGFVALSLCFCLIVFTIIGSLTIFVSVFMKLFMNVPKIGII